jgi:uncharacterized membrane protein
MAVLIVGLIVFLGLHSVRVVAEPWRVRQQAALGEARWKILYSVVSIGSLALVIWGFSLARVATPVLWVPPKALHSVTALLVLVAFVLLVAGYVPGTRIQAAVGHPVTLSAKTWSFAHLLSAGTLADVVLFGSFLGWSVVVFVSARRRDRASFAAASAAATQAKADSVTAPAAKPRPQGTLARDAVAVVIGAAAWFVFRARLHEWLIGVRPFD